MAMTIRPADGLVTRLLQQQTRSTGVTAQEAGRKEKTSDQVSISSQARQQTAEVVGNKSQNAFGYKRDKLESQLIGLYTKHEPAEPKG